MVLGSRQTAKAVSEDDPVVPFLDILPVLREMTA
jgi:hypothetical protein